MKAQFGKQNLIHQATGNHGLGVVVAGAYRVVSLQDRPASERLSPDCRESLRSMRSLRQESRDRLHQSVVALWRSNVQRAIPTIDPGAATLTARSAAESRLPAPAWAAFVLNHALCG